MLKNIIASATLHRTRIEPQYAPNWKRHDPPCSNSSVAMVSRDRVERKCGSCYHRLCRPNQRNCHHCHAKAQQKYRAKLLHNSAYAKAIRAIVAKYDGGNKTT